MSLSGRSAVNHMSGEQTATAIAHHARCAPAPRLRKRAKSSGMSAVPASALSSASAAGAGSRTPIAWSPPVDALASAMNTG
jgi:hypothetical protein